MKTTLNIDPALMERVKREAARRGCTMRELIESALRLMLSRQHKPAPRDLPPLPSYDSGGFLVNIDDRDALCSAMDEAG